MTRNIYDEVTATLAALLQTTGANVRRRMVAMKIGDYCARCGGCGHYSYNTFNGTTCFKCNGTGIQLPADLTRLVPAVRAAVDAGRLTSYLANLAARKAAKDAVALVMAAWKDVDNLNGYSANWRHAALPENADRVRRNTVCVEAYNRVDEALNGKLVKGKRTPKLPPVEALRVFQDALAEIATVKAELVSMEEPA